MSIVPWYLRKPERAHLAKPEGPRKHPSHIAHFMCPDANACIPKLSGSVPECGGKKVTVRRFATNKAVSFKVQDRHDTQSMGRGNLVSMKIGKLAPL